MTTPVPPSEPSDGGTDPTTTNRKAVASIVCGVAGFLSLFIFPFGAFALGLPAITASIHAHREIEESNGSQTGDNLAVLGLLIGSVGLFFGIIALGLSALPRA